jgi:G3E family GTPase
MAQLSRADAIFLTRCDLAAPEQLQQIEHKIAQVASAPVYRTAFRPRGWINSSGDRLPLHGLHRNRSSHSVETETRTDSKKHSPAA